MANPITKDIGKQSPGRKKDGSINFILIFLTILVVAIAVFFWSTYLITDRILSSTNKKIQDADTRLEELALISEQATTLSLAVDNISSIITGQKLWSQVLVELADRSSKNAQLTKFSVDEKNRATIEGITNSFSAVSYMTASLRNSDAFNSVEIINTSYGTGEGRAGNVLFSIEAEINPTMLREIEAPPEEPEE